MSLITTSPHPNYIKFIPLDSYQARGHLRRRSYPHCRAESSLEPSSTIPNPGAAAAAPHYHASSPILTIFDSWGNKLFTTKSPWGLAAPRYQFIPYLILLGWCIHRTICCFDQYLSLCHLTTQYDIPKPPLVCYYGECILKSTFGECILKST